MLTLQTRAHRRHADDWQRSDGGVWLPGGADVPRVAGDPMRGAGMVRRGMGFGFEPAGCCYDACVCTCNLSSNGCAPCCFKVTIAGMVNDAYCTSCANLNKTYYLKQTAIGSNVWKCTHLCPNLGGWECTDKGATWEITLTVTDEGTDQYKITLELGPHKWAKTYAGKPNLATISDALSWVSDSGSCTSNNSTCSIQATLHPLDECLCACQVTCPQCIDQLVTSTVEVTIAGFENAGDCWACPDIDGTYTLRYTSCGTRVLCCGKTFYGGGTGPTWESGRVGTWPCPRYPCGYSNLNIIFSMLRDSNTGVWYAGVSVGPNSATECTFSDCQGNKAYSYFVKTLDLEGTKIDCRSFSFDGFAACSPPPNPQGCDASGVTVTVTAL